MEQSHNEAPIPANNVPFDFSAIDFDAVRDEVLEKRRTGEIEATPEAPVIQDMDSAVMSSADRKATQREDLTAANDHGEEKKAA